MGFPMPDTGAVTEDSGVVGGLLTVSGDADFGPFLNGDAGQWTAETITGAYGSQLVIDSDGNWTYTADNANATIQALDAGETLTEVFTITSTRGTTTVTITINGTDEPPCFVAGTLMETPHGKRPIEDLRAGDEIVTADNGVQRIRWIGSRAIRFGEGAELRALQPVVLRAHALGPGVPDRDIRLSPMHRVLVRDPLAQLLTGEAEVFCPVTRLVNGRSIVRQDVSEVEYFHILFEDHQILRAHGCDSESFFPGRVGLEGFADETREEVLTLFPDLRALPESYGQTARRVLKRFEADLVRDRFCPEEVFLERLRKFAA